MDAILPYVNHRRCDDAELEAMKATKEHKRLMRRGRSIAKACLEGLVGFDGSIESMRNKLTDKTLKRLINNYEESVITSILEALCDFQGAVKLSNVCRMFMDELLPILKDNQKEAGAQAKNLDDLLKSASVSEEQKSLLEQMRRIVRSQSGESFEEAELDMNLMSQLSFMELLFPSGSQLHLLRDTGYDKFFWSNILLLQAAGFYRKQGRPKDIFIKGLQNVVYTLLMQGLSTDKKGPVQFSKSLTAAIINEAYSGSIKRLTPKDVDNTVLHSDPLT